MPPEESPPRPAPPPRPSQRIALDGVSSRPVQQPVISRRPSPLTPPTPQPPTLQHHGFAPPPSESQQDNPATLPAAPTPPVAQPVMTPLPQTPDEAEPAPSKPHPATPQPLQFTALSTKKRRRFLLPALVAVVVIVVAAGGFAWFKVQAAKNNPDNAFKDALLASLQVTQLQTHTVSGDSDVVALHDFSNATNPIVSTTGNFTLGKGSFEGAGYGSAQNTYFSYTKMPASVPKSVASVTLSAWVQLRAKGVLPSGVTPELANLSDPRFQNFGLVPLGNYPLKTREQIASFLISNHAYQYQISQVTHATLDGARVLAYPITLSVGYIKIAHESTALASHFTAADVQAALDSLTPYQGATGTIYIDTAQHRIRKITVRQNSQEMTVSYSHYDGVTLPDEPQTKLNWQFFAPLEARIEGQHTK